MLRKRIALWLALFLLIVPVATPAESEDVFRVIRVVDGDTLVISGGNKVRLLGVNTPELHHPKKPVQCFAHEAKRYVQNRVKGENIKLTYEGSKKGPYGRILAWVWYGDGYKKLLNADIIRDGYGFSYRKYPTSRLKQLNRLEAQARKAERGLWAPGACGD